jgi:hypothetical protein
MKGTCYFIVKSGRSAALEESALLIQRFEKMNGALGK